MRFHGGPFVIESSSLRMVTEYLYVGLKQKTPNKLIYWHVDIIVIISSILWFIVFLAKSSVMMHLLSM